MTSFWWLQRGWCETECKDCGANIKASGGDPDWGRCSGCFDRHVAGKEAERMHEAKMVEQHAAQIRSMHEAVLIGEMRGRVQAAFDDVARAKQQADAGFTADMTVEFGHSHWQWDGKAGTRKEAREAAQEALALFCARLREAADWIEGVEGEEEGR